MLRSITLIYVVFHFQVSCDSTKTSHYNEKFSNFPQHNVQNFHTIAWRESQSGATYRGSSYPLLHIVNHVIPGATTNHIGHVVQDVPITNILRASFGRFLGINGLFSFGISGQRGAKKRNRDGCGRKLSLSAVNIGGSFPKWEPLN